MSDGSRTSSHRLGRALLGVRYLAWARFSGQTAHPPMRGWLAAPIRDRDRTAWGLVQLSDRADGQDYDHNDVEMLTTFVTMLTATLQALWDLRNERVNSGLPRARLLGERPGTQ